jgi:outer membrane protein OmpA-like peptidoglycan-associated protein
MTPARAMVLAVVCAACAGVAHPNPDRLTAPRDRITDEAVASDLSLIDRWNARLVALRDSADQIRYGEAEAWLVAARQQYSDNDPTDNAARSLDSAKAIIGGLEHDRATGATLWSAPAPRSDSAQRALGWAQVTMRMAALTNSDVAECRGPWYKAVGDSLLGESHRLMMAPVTIAGPALASRIADTVATVVATVVEAPPTMPTASEIAFVAHSVHFAVNSAKIGVTSKPELDRLSALLKRYPRVMAELDGFADPRGNVDRNLVLSQHRAESVRDYIVVAGANPAHVLLGYRAIVAAGADTSLEKYAHDRNVQITLVGTDGLPIKAETQDRDLQVEQARPHRSTVSAPLRRPPLAKKASSKKTAPHKRKLQWQRASAATRRDRTARASAAETPCRTTRLHRRCQGSGPPSR